MPCSSEAQMTSRLPRAKTCRLAMPKQTRYRKENKLQDHYISNRFFGGTPTKRPSANKNSTAQLKLPRTVTKETPLFRTRTASGFHPKERATSLQTRCCSFNSVTAASNNILSIQRAMGGGGYSFRLLSLQFTENQQSIPISCACIFFSISINDIDSFIVYPACPNTDSVSVGQ